MDIRQISSDRVAVLKKYGFQESTSEHRCGMADYFYSPILFRDTGMLVTGDHATDYATLIYAEEDGRCGLFYAPSMLEYLLLDFGGEWSVERLMRDLNHGSDCKLTLEAVGGLPMIYTEIDDTDWKTGDLDYQVSDMLKVIGRLDYILLRKRNKFWRAREKRQRELGS